MKTSEPKKLLSGNGCRIVRHGTNHDIWMSPVTGKEFLVRRHDSKEVPTGTANRILKDAGIK